MKIVDVEYSWNLNHEDLTTAVGSRTPNGTPCDPFRDKNHGTAVLGELIAGDNGFGVTGIVPGADIGVTNTARKTVGGCSWSPARAINTAAAALTAGDIILIEQQTYGPDDELLPVEWVTSAYDAIKSATASGIIVVEAAGNGGENLDDPIYGATFPKGKADSGAIIVGAGGCNGVRVREFFSNYGSRVNVQGWGGCVTTTGYGYLFGTEPNNLYTTGFGGTSSASPIVAGAAAAILGAHEAATDTVMSPHEVRDLLIATGSPQVSPELGHIGPFPNLSLALLGDTPPAAPQGVTATGSDAGVTLSWDAPADPDVTGYTIYRARQALAGFQAIATIGARTSYLDKQARPGVASYYQITAVDAGGQISEVAATSGVRTGPGVVQEDQATYTGAWQSNSCSCFSGGSVMSSTEAGASAEFEFTGFRITFISSQGPDYGAVRIFINGNLKTTWVQSSSEPHYLEDTWTKKFQTSATRTLKLVTVDFQGATRIDVDAFAVKP